MSPVQYALVLAGIPVALAVVIYVLVSAGSWTRSGRASADWEAGPLLVHSDAAVPNPAIIASGKVLGGGARGRW